MGGDHKCPVCEATFTRPQHVARHMRSHTGDRPYKCQFCGDQFARSDLLSRHVNKCHANEKPLPSTGLRKKGSVSASRATTSKQVCDQCVQANTSCDGCNPCAKCVQRRYRCTFVKFHRQTAPLGPGHTTRTAESSFSNPPSPSSIAASSPSRVSAPSSSREPVFHHPPHQQQSDDEFILGPPPTVVPTMADALYGATPYSFPPLYPTNDISGDNTDFVGKYRAHAELFGSTRSAIPALSSSMVSPNLYDPRPPSSWLGWGQHDPTDAYQQQQQRHIDLIDSAHPPPSLSPISSLNDKDMQVDLARRHNHHQHQQRSNTNPNHYMNAAIPFSVPQSTTSNYHLVSDPNGVMGAESTDIHGSDSASSSAASSFVHLPLSGVDNISARGLLVRGGYDNNGVLIPDRRATSSTSSSSSSHHHHHSDHHQNLAQVSFPTTHDENAFSSNQHHHQHQHQHQSHSHPHHLSQQQVIPDLGRPPEFSSAFGLLSLDDPNVTAGIATDGTPFFDDPNQTHNQQARKVTSGSTTTTTSGVVQLGGGNNTVADMDTPMPLKGSSGQLQLLSLDQKFPISAAAGAGVVVVDNGNTPSRERDSKELKEFWKQYMRIPLSGSDMMSGSEGVTPSGNANKASGPGPGPGLGPGPGYRRSRVASLPAVKTPIAERARDQLDAQAVYLNPAHPSASPGMPAGMGRMDMDTTGMDNSEDLRSYEAAVRARKGPTMLNLKVKRPMKGRGRAGGGGSGSKLIRDEGGGASSGNNSPGPMGSGGGGEITDRSSSSSLANAFGTGRLNCHSHWRDQTVLSAPGPGATTLSFAGGVKKEEEISSSLLLSSPASSSAEGEDNQSDFGSLEVPSSPLMMMIGGSSSDMGGRPSFKRLPSQTLGPDNSKRPFYGFGGEDVEDRVVNGWGAIGGNDDDDRKDFLVGGGGGGGHGGGSAERRMRKRRMSEPSKGLTGGGFDREDTKKSSRVDVSAVQNVDELWFTSY